MDINNLGNYASMTAVWNAFPDGGHEGDYLYIPNESGTKYNWDKYLNEWVTEEHVSPSRHAAEFSEVEIDGDLTVGGDASVDGDLHVGGLIRAAGVKQPNVGLFATLTALQTAYPNPVVGMWAVVGDSVPGDIYRCDTAGTWTATGETGGVDELENVLLYGEQSLTSAQRAQVLENLGIEVITDAEMDAALAD